jgi:hypothetical protein
LLFELSEINEPLLYENYFYEFILLSSSFIDKTIKRPIKKTTKQKAKPAPVSPFPFPYTITLRIAPE